MGIIHRPERRHAVLQIVSRLAAAVMALGVNLSCYGGIAVMRPVVMDNDHWRLHFISWDGVAETTGTQGGIRKYSENGDFNAECNVAGFRGKAFEGEFSAGSFRAHVKNGSAIVLTTGSILDQKKCKTMRYYWNTGGDAYGTISVLMKLRWDKVPLPVSCKVATENISLPPTSNIGIVSGSGIVRLTCDGPTDFIVSVAEESNGRVQYTAGGAVDMTFDGGDPARPYTIHGRAERAGVVETTLRATTVAGWAEPGTYIGHAVLRVELP